MICDVEPPKEHTSSCGCVFHLLWHRLHGGNHARLCGGISHVEFCNTHKDGGDERDFARRGRRAFGLLTMLYEDVT